jgi:hypothetical protein
MPNPLEIEHAEAALRRLQVLDEVADLGDHRHLLIAAETELGEILGFECTGEVDGENADGTSAFYSHNGDTCPIHEWLVEEDARGIGKR